MGRVVGADSGSAYSAVAIVGGNGKPEVSVNRDGEWITSSVVCFDGSAMLVSPMAKL